MRSGLAGAATALAGGFVSTQYVGTRFFSVLAPALVGLASSWAVTAAAGRGGAGHRRLLFVVAAASALLATALGFRLVPGGQGLATAAGDVVPPYVAAVVGAMAWPVLFGVRRSGSGPSPSARQPGRGTDA